MTDTSISTTELHAAAGMWAEGKLTEAAAADPAIVVAVRESLAAGHALTACVLITGGVPAIELCLLGPDRKLRPVLQARADGPSETRN